MKYLLCLLFGCKVTLWEEAHNYYSQCNENAYFGNCVRCGRGVTNVKLK